MLHSTKERSGLYIIRSNRDIAITKYAWISCAFNQKKVLDLLKEERKVLVAMDMSTHTSTSYPDVCIRLNLNRHGIVNLHLLAIPVYERHTQTVIFFTVANSLDVLCTF